MANDNSRCDWIKHTHTLTTATSDYPANAAAPPTTRTIRDVPSEAILDVQVRKSQWERLENVRAALPIASVTIRAKSPVTRSAQ